MLNARAARFSAGLILMVLVLRCIAQARVPLMHQEAYYWMYAQHPSLSYYDHPPMVAWVIGLGTKLFGDSEWGVRVVGGALMILNGVLMYRFARLWWTRRIAIASALLAELSPVFFGIGLMATMDSALLAFWLLSMIGFSLAVRRGRTAGWYLCGLGLGGALLSKYTGVMLIPGVGMLLLFHRPWRRYLVSPHPYLACLLGIAMFSPVLYWNAQHDWASFRFQFLSRIAKGDAHNYLLLFIGLQIAAATPLVIWGAGLILRHAAVRRRMTGRDKLALAFSLPLLLSIANKSLTFPVHIDWAAPAYLSLIPASLHAARVFLRSRRGGATAWSWRTDASTLTLQVSLACNFAMMLFLLLVQPRTHAMSMFGPWDQLAGQVERCEDALQAKTGHEPLVIVDDKYELASLVAFYRNRVDSADRPSMTTVNRVALGGTSVGYAYWADRSAWPGMDCIGVDEGDGSNADRFRDRFKSVRVVWSGIASNGSRYSIFECRGYRSL